jgi:phosphatidyl-myo-inositol dimannoside synthase
VRILLLTPVFPPARGGIEVTAGRLAEHLEGDLLVVTLRPGSGTATGPAPAGRPGSRVVRLPNEPRGGRRSVLLLNAVALAAGARFRPGVVVSLHVKASPAAHALGAALRVPVVQWVHAKEMREVPGLASFAVERATAVVGVSAYSGELAVAAGADPSRLTILPPGVDPPSARRTGRDARPTLVTVSRLEDRYKGHDVVLRALPAIRAAVPDVSWVVIGDGALRPELERAAAAAGLGDAVRFLGAVDDAMRDAWLDRAWAFVQPSRQPDGDRAGEGFGIAFVEAGAHGLPVVGGRIPGVVDAVLDGATGLLVDPTDPAAVAGATVALLTDRDAAERIGAAGIARARELAWPRVVARVQALLEELIVAGRPRRAGRRRAAEARPPGSRHWARELLTGPERPEP